MFAQVFDPLKIPDDVLRWLGDLHQVLPSHWVGAIATIAAVICGALIGYERERASKPAGVRTLILICLGAAVFAQASVLLANDPSADRSRVAAQVVSGIGFLGAGAIIREGGLVVGLTTAAAMWAAAAVGVVVGSGHVAAGLFFTLLIVLTLGASSFIERSVHGPCRFATATFTFDPRAGKTRLRIDALLEDHEVTAAVTYFDPVDDLVTATIRYCSIHRAHRAFLTELARLSEVKTIEME